MELNENSVAGITAGLATLSGNTNDFQVDNKYVTDYKEKETNINKTKMIFDKINNAQLLNNILLKDINLKNKGE